MKRFSRTELEAGWTALGTYLVILAVAILSGGFSEVWETVRLFFVGKPNLLLDPDATLFRAIPLASAILVIDLPISIAVAYIVHSLPKVHAGNLTRNAGWIGRLRQTITDHDNDGAAHVFAMYFAVIFLEEAFARWLFLGVLYFFIALVPIPIVQVVAFYLLFLLGNGLWALAHLGNYERRFGRSILWVAPQFIGGIGLTIMYWRYGFWAALITHFAFDAMIWCFEKQQRFDPWDLRHLWVSGLYAVVSYCLLSHDIAEIAQLVEMPVETIRQTWGMWDFTVLCLFFSGVSGVLFGLLLYDQSGSDKQSSFQALLKGGVGSILACYFAVWILQGIAGSTAIAILIFALLKAFGARDTSLNAMCRTFWSSVPLAAIIVCAVRTLPFLSAVGFLIVTGLLLLPLALLEYLARDS